MMTHAQAVARGFLLALIGPPNRAHLWRTTAAHKVDKHRHRNRTAERAFLRLCVLAGFR